MKENVKRFNFLMSETDHRELKALAAKDGMTIKECLQTMLDFVLTMAKRRRKEIEESKVDVDLTNLSLSLMDDNAFQGLLEMAKDQSKSNPLGIQNGGKAWINNNQAVGL